MNLIIIHGPPAVGKLTVAKEISKITKYKVFHNHLILDAVESLIDPKSKEFWPLVNKLREDLIKSAIKNKVNGVIYTRADIASDKFSFVRKLKKIVENNKGKIYFVHLICSEKKLMERVNSPSRRKYLKTTSSSKLKKSLKEWDFKTKFPKVRTLEIDNNNLSPKRTAQIIKSKLKIK